MVKPKIAGVFQAGNFRRRLLSQRLPGSRFQGNGWGVYPPKSSAIPTSLHPDIHFSAIISRREEKSKIFLSVVIYVVKADFIPLSAIVESPANAGAARLCGVSPHPIPDTATALPNQARYQLRYTRILFQYTTAAGGREEKIFGLHK